MKKQIVAFMSAALIALAAPVAAHAWESPSGAVKAETITVTTESGVNVRAAAACNGTGTLKIEEAAEDVKAPTPRPLRALPRLAPSRLPAPARLRLRISLPTTWVLLTPTPR